MRLTRTQRPSSFGVVESLLQASGDALLPVTHLQLEMAAAALQDGIGSVIEGVRGGIPSSHAWHTPQQLAKLLPHREG